VKHAISVPSVLTGRRVRWTFELSAERQEIPVSIPPLASGPQTSAPAESIVTRRGTPAFALVLAVAAVGVVGALALVRHLASDQEYEVADPSFASQASTDRESQASTDRDSTVAPLANVPATPPAPPTATPTAADLLTPIVRPIAAKQGVAEAESTPSRKRPKEAERTPSGKGTKIVAVSVPATKTVATPIADTHEPEQAPATAAAVSAIAISPPPATPATAAPLDEVTITGCLEIAKDDDRFRLSDTEGASAPQARSWRSGFFKKRSAPVDLIGSTEALTLHREVGQRVAVRGVLSSRKLKVSSVHVVAPSCN
jgi:cytoskeletal protein RodZ